MRLDVALTRVFLLHILILEKVSLRKRSFELPNKKAIATSWKKIEKFLMQVRGKLFISTFSVNSVFRLILINFRKCMGGAKNLPSTILIGFVQCVFQSLLLGLLPNWH